MKTSIIIHHSLTKDGDTVSTDDIERFHIEEQGWLDVGYHYLLEVIDGHPYAIVGRPEQGTAAAVKEGNWNRKGIHICVVGNYDEEEPSQAVLEVLVKRLLVPIMRRNKIGTQQIYGHNHFAGYKTCPGKLFPLDKVIQMVKDNWNLKTLK